MDKIKTIFAEHKWTIILVLLGILLTVLLLTIGFFKTLLFVGVVGVCLFIGVQLDKKDGSLKEFFRNVFHKGDNK